MRCVPRRTPNIRLRGNCKSALTGSRQAPRYGLGRDSTWSFLGCVPRDLPGLILRFRKRFAGFSTLFFLTRVVGAGVGGTDAPARAGIPSDKSKSPATAKSMPRRIFFTVIPPVAIEREGRVARIMTNHQPVRKGNFPRA